jgi:hypothetical protein
MSFDGPLLLSERCLLPSDGGVIRNWRRWTFGRISPSGWTRINRTPRDHSQDLNSPAIAPSVDMVALACRFEERRSATLTERRWSPINDVGAES